MADPKKKFKAAKYTNGDVIVEAVQLTKESFDDVVDFLGGNATIKRKTCTVLVHGLEGNQLARPTGKIEIPITTEVKNATGRKINKKGFRKVDHKGDYVLAQNGSFGVMTAADFEAEFEKVKDKK